MSINRDNVFPPEATRSAEIDAVVDFYRGVLRPKTAVYVSAPITSGRRFIEWLGGRRQRPPLDQTEYREEHFRNVVVPNRKSVRALVDSTTKGFGHPVIDPTAVGDLPGWKQGDYRIAWARIIEEFARLVLFANGWHFSNGCAFEFLVAA